MTDIVQPVIDWVVGLMGILGGPGAGVAVALENLFPPIPSEVILPLAGFAAARGEMGLLEAIACSTLGSVVGALALYGLGAWFGRTRLRRIVERMPGVKVSGLDRAEDWSRRHGEMAVLMGRLVPLVRSLVSIPAGLERMPLRRFTVYTALGSAAWNTLLIVAGYQLGANWELVGAWIATYQSVVVVGLLLGLGAWMGARRFRRIRPATPARRRQPAAD